MYYSTCETEKLANDSIFYVPPLGMLSFLPDEVEEESW